MMPKRDPSWTRHFPLDVAGEELVQRQAIEALQADRIRVLPDGRIETKETNEDFDRRVAAIVKGQADGYKRRKSK